MCVTRRTWTWTLKLRLSCIAPYLCCRHHKGAFVVDFYMSVDMVVRQVRLKLRLRLLRLLLRWTHSLIVYVVCECCAIIFPNVISMTD